MWLRAGTPADSQDLFTLQRAAAIAAYGHVFPPEQYPFPDQQIAELCWRMLTSRTEQVLVAVGDDGPVGYVSRHDERITHLYVDPLHWRRGVGSRLLAAAVDSIRQDGHGIARLWVMSKNHRARALYEQHGWQPDGTSSEARFPPYPALLGYALALSDADPVGDPRPAGNAATAPPSGSTGAPVDEPGTTPERTGPRPD